MRSFTKGLLVGIGVGLLIAPMKGEELRRVLAERAEEWRQTLPEDSLVNQYTRRVSERVADAREHWREYAQQFASAAKDAGMTLSNQAAQAGQKVSDKAKERTQEMAGRTKQGVGSSRSTHGERTRVAPADGETEDYI